MGAEICPLTERKMIIKRAFCKICQAQTYSESGICITCEPLVVGKEITLFSTDDGKTLRNISGIVEGVTLDSLRRCGWFLRHARITKEVAIYTLEFQRYRKCMRFLSETSKYGSFKCTACLKG